MKKDYIISFNKGSPECISGITIDKDGKVIQIRDTVPQEGWISIHEEDSIITDYFNRREQNNKNHLESLCYNNTIYLKVYIDENDVKGWTPFNYHEKLSKLFDYECKPMHLLDDPITSNKKIMASAREALYLQIEHKVKQKHDEYINSIQTTYHYDQMIKYELQKYLITKTSKLLEYKAYKENTPIEDLVKNLSEYFNKQDNVLTNFQYVEQHLKDWVDAQETFLPYFDFDVYKEIDTYVNECKIEIDTKTLGEDYEMSANDCTIT